jgi:hypothetical protein
MKRIKLFENFNSLSYLNVVFKSKESFELAKNHFLNVSVFYPELQNEEFKTLGFSVKSQEDADNLEKELVEEFNKIDLDDYYFEQE